MKINLGSASDVPAVKTGLKADGKSEQNSDENEGFFSKLASFFSGDSDAGSQVSSVKEGAAVQAGTDTGEDGLSDGNAAANIQMDSDAQVKQLASQQDMDLTSDLTSDLTGDTEVVTDPKIQQDVASSKVSAKPSDSAPPIASSEVEKVSLPANDVSQVMDEGKQVLSRLKEANATLSSGKALPQTHKESAPQNLDSGIHPAEEAQVVSDIQKDSSKFVSAEKTKMDVKPEPGEDAEPLMAGYSFKDAQPVHTMKHLSKEYKDKPIGVVSEAVLPDDNPAPDFVPLSQNTDGAQKGEPSLAEYTDNSPQDPTILDDIVPNQTEIMSRNADLQDLTASDVANMEKMVGAGVSEPGDLSPQLLKQMMQKEKAALSTQHGVAPSLSEQPVDNQMMYFAPGVTAGMANESSQSASVMFVDTDGKVIDLGKLNKPELEKLAHRHGQTVSQLISGAVQANMSQHHQSQLISMQMSDKSSADFLQSSTNVASNASLNNAAMNEAVSQMSKNMAKSFEHKNALAESGRFSDIREMDGEKMGKEPHLAQSMTAMSSQNSHTFSQVSRADAPQPPVQINKDNASDQLAERINVMLSKNLKNIDIRLDPPDLGKVHIRMHMNGDATSVQFTVANHHAREALENSMPRLREMLSQQGVQVGDTAVQHQSGQQQNGYAASGRGQNGQPQSDGSAAGPGFSDENNESDVTLRVNVPSPKDGISYYA